jgi:hypothetical protein
LHESFHSNPADFDSLKRLRLAYRLRLTRELEKNYELVSKNNATLIERRYNRRRVSE